MTTKKYYRKCDGMICLNAQGFLKHKDEIENVLIGIDRPSILGFTETRVMRAIEDHELHFERVTCIRRDSKSNKMGRVLLCIDNRIKFEIKVINSCLRN